MHTAQRVIDTTVSAIVPNVIATEPLALSSDSLYLTRYCQPITLPLAIGNWGARHDAYRLRRCSGRYAERVLDTEVCRFLTTRSMGFYFGNVYFRQFGQPFYFRENVH